MSEVESSKVVALIGLGRMGQPMATRLSEAGYHMIGYDVDAAVRAAACPVLIVPPVVETEGAAQRSSDTLAGA